jgi:hypothetical protein
MRSICGSLDVILPIHLALTPGEAHDNRLCPALLSALLPQTMLLADRGVTTRYDKLAVNYLAFVKLASIRIWLRAHESTPWPKAFLNGGHGVYYRARFARPGGFADPTHALHRVRDTSRSYK